MKKIILIIATLLFDCFLFYGQTLTYLNSNPEVGNVVVSIDNNASSYEVKILPDTLHLFQYTNKAYTEFDYKKTAGTDTIQIKRDSTGIVVWKKNKEIKLKTTGKDIILLQDIVFYQLREIPVTQKIVIDLIYNDTNFTKVAIEPIADKEIIVNGTPILCRGVTMYLEGIVSWFAYIKWNFYFSSDERNLPVLAEEYKRDKKLKSSFGLMDIK